MKPYYVQSARSGRLIVEPYIHIVDGEEFVIYCLLYSEKTGNFVGYWPKGHWTDEYKRFLRAEGFKGGKRFPGIPRRKCIEDTR